MKKIKSLEDISFIVRNKLDVKDDIGQTVTLFRLLGFKLFKILEIIENGEWKYDTE